MQPVVHAVDASQWASSATASTEYAGYPARNTVGAPNADGCKSPNGVWIPLSMGSSESLTVTFSKSVKPKRIDVFQNNYKNAISKIEVSSDGKSWEQVYTGDLSKGAKGSCKASAHYDDILSAPVSDISGYISQVKISFDHSVIGNFVQIDAVKLTGTLAPTQLKKGKKLTYAAAANAADINVSAKSTIVITSSSAACVVDNKAKVVTGNKVGVCLLRVSVTTASGSKTTKSLDVSVQ